MHKSIILSTHKGLWRYEIDGQTIETTMRCDGTLGVRSPMAMIRLLEGLNPGYTAIVIDKQTCAHGGERHEEPT